MRDIVLHAASCNIFAGTVWRGATPISAQYRFNAAQNDMNMPADFAVLDASEKNPCVLDMTRTLTHIANMSNCFGKKISLSGCGFMIKLTMDERL